jgi:aspartate aminotransferase
MTSPSSAKDRLSNISSHIMASSNPSVFTAALVAAAPEDPLFGLMKAYREDPSDKKVDLGIGAYRDNNAKPWILPVVKKVTPKLRPSIMVIALTRTRPMTPSTTTPA